MIMPFPGGIAASGSKAGSRYKFMVASTYEAFCPTLRDRLGEIVRATQAAIAACLVTPGLAKISAGNYAGRLGKSFIYLRPELQP